MKKRVGLFLLILMISLPVVARSGRGPKSEGRRDQIDAMRIWKMTEALDLTTEEAGRLFPVLHEFRGDRKALHRQEMEIIGKLEEIISSRSGDSEALEQALEALQEVRKQMTALPVKEMDRLKEVLTIEKLARFAVFQVKFERKIRSMIRDAGRGGSPDRHPPVPPGP